MIREKEDIIHSLKEELSKLESGQAQPQMAVGAMFRCRKAIIVGDSKEERAKSFILGQSCWIDIKGSENSCVKDHFVKAQGEIVLKLLDAKFKKDTGDIPKLFIITPFTSVKAGTVHTFQGQGTDEVIFLLGCDSNSIGAANWVNKNIVNVAATRAKFRFYMIGDKNVWTCKPVRIARECTKEIIQGKDIDTMLVCPKCGKMIEPIFAKK